MSFEAKMKPKLNPKGDQENDWYIKATMEAMNEYMEELEKTLSQYVLRVYGQATFIVPASPPYPYVQVINSNERAAFVPMLLRFTYEEVKNAMWCGNIELSYYNLFTLFGNKLAANFLTVKTSPFIAGATVPPVWTTAHWGSLGFALISYAKSLGKFCTPEKFLAKQSELMYQGIKATIAAPCPCSGTVPPLQIQPLVGENAVVPANVIPLPGVFVGFVEASFARVDS